MFGFCTVMCYTFPMTKQKAIPWEDGLNSKQRSILIGSLLGDARLECRSITGTARLRIHQSDRQRDLVFWKYQEFKSLVYRKPWKTSWMDKRNGKTYVSWFFHTKTTEEFRPWVRAFYPNGKKVLPYHIFHLLDPLALAVWFMDDGCFSNQTIILNTQSFSDQEHSFLQEWFQKRWLILPAIHHDRKNLRLYFGKRWNQKLLKMIEPHLLPSFYKTVPVTTEVLKDEIRGT